MRDTIGLILLSQGVDITKPPSMDQWQAGLAVLEQQLNSGQIRQVKGNSYKEDLVSKDAVAVVCWSGDMFQLSYENGEGSFGFGLPESGGTLWSDNLMVPIGSPHKTNAEKLINFYYEPAIAAEVAAWVNYICPVKGAKEAMAKMPDVDQQVLDSPFIFPTDADLAKVHQFASLDDETATAFTEAFQKVLGV
jgi:spermidine/putrescine transport system substrate-binding protein